MSISRWNFKEFEIMFQILINQNPVILLISLNNVLRFFANQNLACIAGRSEYSGLPLWWKTTCPVFFQFSASRNYNRGQAVFRSSTTGARRANVWILRLPAMQANQNLLLPSFYQSSPIGKPDTLSKERPIISPGVCIFMFLCKLIKIIPLHWQKYFQQ